MVTKTKIVLAEDDIHWGEFMVKLVDETVANADIHWAQNGKDALKSIQEIVPHFAILDLEMPGMNGIELLTAIRTTYKDLPVIFCSSLINEERMNAIAHLKPSGGINKQAGLGAIRLLLTRLLQQNKIL